MAETKTVFFMGKTKTKSAERRIIDLSYTFHLILILQERLVELGK